MLRIILWCSLIVSIGLVPMNVALLLHTGGDSTPIIALMANAVGIICSTIGLRLP